MTTPKAEAMAIAECWLDSRLDECRDFMTPHGRRLLAERLIPLLSAQKERDELKAWKVRAEELLVLAAKAENSCDCQQSLCVGEHYNDCPKMIGAKSRAFLAKQGEGI